MRADWNRRASEDAFYHVAFEQRLQDPEQFLAGGAQTAALFERELIYLPASDPASQRALEIGCGPGRLMRPMSRHFGEIHGIDISDEMLERARQLLADIPHAHLHLAEESDLRMFVDNWFEFVYSYAVFQHIPSREVILNYLDEMARVLKAGGIMCCQMRGAPAPSSELNTGSPTWTGAGHYFQLHDIGEFVTKHGLQLVTAWGVDTQHMFITVRKPPRKIEIGIKQSSPELLGVRPSSDGYSRSIPRRGCQAAVSLWFTELPEDCGLTDLEVNFGRVKVIPSHITLFNGGPRQVNALLPRNFPAGPVRIGAAYRGRPLEQTFELNVVEGDPQPPLIVSVTDAESLGLKHRICSGALKIAIQNVESPETLQAWLGDVPLQLCEVVREDPVTAQYQYSLEVPLSVASGAQVLKTTVDGFPLPPIPVEVYRGSTAN